VGPGGIAFAQLAVGRPAASRRARVVWCGRRRGGGDRCQRREMIPAGRTRSSTVRAKLPTGLVHGRRKKREGTKRAACDSGAVRASCMHGWVVAAPRSAGEQVFTRSKIIKCATPTSVSTNVKPFLISSYLKSLAFRNGGSSTGRVLPLGFVHNTLHFVFVSTT
jgi:hypothetical protein